MDMPSSGQNYHSNLLVIRDDMVGYYMWLMSLSEGKIAPAKLGKAGHFG
jgi:hypothetical protein